MTKAYKTKDGHVMVYHPVNKYWITSATPIEPTVYSCWDDGSIKRESTNGALQEVILDDLKWIHPHLLKSIREQMLEDNL